MLSKAEVSPIQRLSLTEPLASIYSNGSTGRNPSVTSEFGRGAKDAGTDKTATNFVDTTNIIQSNLTINQRPSSTNYTNSALNYSTKTLKLDTTKYTGR